MCETRHLGIQWPAVAHFCCEGQVAVDRRLVCPQDVKKMLLKQARRWSIARDGHKHECEELKEGVWLEPIQAMLRRKTQPNRGQTITAHVMRKLVVEGGWVQKRSCDTSEMQPEDYSPVAYPVSKQLSTLLRQGHLPREHMERLISGE